MYISKVLASLALGCKIKLCEPISLPVIVNVPSIAWLPVNWFEPVVAKLPVFIVLPLTSGITTPNVDVSPFVNVKVFPLNEAVTNDKLAEVNKLAVALFRFVIEVAKELVVEFKLEIDILTLADVLSKLFNLIFVDWV